MRAICSAIAKIQVPIAKPLSDQVPSSKGKPTDPKLREKVKEEVKNETNKDGGGKGQWSAWKASKLSKEYEKKGGGYENEAGSKNEPKKGAPKKKAEGKKKAEEKEVDEGKVDEKEEEDKSEAKNESPGIIKMISSRSSKAGSQKKTQGLQKNVSKARKTNKRIAQDKRTTQ
ncbi:hypothetical protein P3342_005473 [Pyrenophora teres f. teres]|nr:hypothetical protein P3342_005473 [Pyrenophora teres f. teres]